MTGAKLASIAVAVAHGGKIIWEESFGWADREKMIAATPQTMYSLASISKPITATGLMTLVERGAIDLDKPANEYLGTGKLTGHAGEATGATVRRVLSHTAGRRFTISSTTQTRMTARRRSTRRSPATASL